MTVARWLAAWALYLVGDRVSVVMNWPGMGRLYAAYNWLMVASSNIQTDAVSGPWWPWKPPGHEGKSP